MFGLTAWLRHGHNISLRKGCNQRKDKKAMKDPKSALEAFRELALEALDKEGDKANEEMERRQVAITRLGHWEGEDVNDSSALLFIPRNRVKK